MKFGAGSAGTKEASSLYNAIWDVCERLERHDLLSARLNAELKEVRHDLSLFLCPYPIEELDRKVKEYDEKLPELLNGYTLSGRTVTWHSRRRKPQAS